MKKFLHIFVLVLVITNWLLVPMEAASRSTVFPVSTKRLSPFLQFVPSSLTAVTSTNTTLWQISVTNDCASAVSFYIEDRQSTPKVLISNRASIASGSTYIFEWPEGVELYGGFKWQASSASCLIVGVKGTYL
jgi:hypothetical protein